MMTEKVFIFSGYVNDEWHLDIKVLEISDCQLFIIIKMILLFVKVIQISPDLLNNVEYVRYFFDKVSKPISSNYY